ncbi:hypothetical protein LTS14_007463 [Recurvomyces mirabilis]|uniref:uncharacterized protein n=1 Tax=Recurvomyces mirabilis TaxID=574656 RepID=UPI002DE04054|nr:hypothetical protein LTS14_007463 [Recurvomyces mirabilis]
MPTFLEYRPETIAQLQGAEACIWCMGTPTSGREVHVDFTFAAAKTFIEHLVPELRKDGKKFRFVYVSGILCERDQNRSLWFLSQARKMRGGVETSLVDLERETEGGFQAMSVRPSGIHKADTSLALKVVMPIVPSGWHIQVEEFAAAMVELAISGDGGHFVENDELKTRGRQALHIPSPVHVTACLAALLGGTINIVPHCPSPVAGKFGPVAVSVEQ